MYILTRTTLALAMLALFAWSPSVVKAEPEEGDWKGGWNTWAEAAEGDWVEYEMQYGITVKYEVVKVDGARLTYARTTFMNGKQTGNKELTREWKKISPLQKLPYGKEDEVEWKDDELEIAGETIKCRVAYWSMSDDVNKGKDGPQAVASEIWYCRDIPCGGIVQVTTKGVASYKVKDFEKVGGPAEGSSLPKFYAKKGNHAVYAVARGGVKQYTRVEVTEVTPEETKWTSTPCDRSGKVEEGAEAEEHKLTQETWDERYGDPDEEGNSVKAADEEFTCNLYKREDGTQEWVTDDGLVVMKMVSTDDGTEVHTLESYEIE